METKLVGTKSVPSDRVGLQITGNQPELLQRRLDAIFESRAIPSSSLLAPVTLEPASNRASQAPRTIVLLLSGKISPVPALPGPQKQACQVRHCYPCLGRSAGDLAQV